MCTGVVTGGVHTDLLCSVDLTAYDTCNNETAAQIRWFFSSPSIRHPITDGIKYGKYPECSGRFVFGNYASVPLLFY